MIADSDAHLQEIAGAGLGMGASDGLWGGGGALGKCKCK